jgi:antitoxin VapB
VSLNIKNEHVHDLAREAARRTGKSQTSVIEEALEKLLADLDYSPEAVKARTEDLLAIAADFQARLTPEDRERMNTDWLYDDETGLPA